MIAQSLLDLWPVAAAVAVAGVIALIAFTLARWQRRRQVRLMHRARRAFT